MNYRVDALGFAAFEEDGGITSNFGLQDQQEALRFLQRALPSFGGDPGRVTIFGESAGGISVLTHLAMPGSAGLFRAAIAESGTLSLFQPDFQVDTTNYLAGNLSCKMD